MQIWDFLFILGFFSFFYYTLFHIIVGSPIVMYRVFVLKQTTDELNKPFIGNIITDYVHAVLIATIVTFAYHTIEDNLIVLVYKCIGGIFIYMIIAKGKIDKYQIDKKVFLKEIFIGSSLIYIVIMIFPIVVINELSYIFIDTVIWLYLIPYVGFILKIIGGFYFTGVFWEGIKSSFMFTKENGYFAKYNKKGFYLLPAINQDNYIHKEQVDPIFKTDVEGWEEYLKELEPILNKDGWSFIKVPCDTGTTYLCDNPNGSRSSAQPLFLENNPSTPLKLIIGTYYPKGSIPFEDDDFRNELISKCNEELGDSYKLEVLFLNFTNEMYNIEFQISKTN